ncbi:fibrinogen-like protein A [Ochlerotatus camptorhynchus]|uniref:fibrinogen-like protein A n=1 Tax=Ochlerotatus camptorhynchus TaxID=644619 RepID=UPI0031E0C365
MTGRISTLAPVLVATLFSVCCWAKELPANDTEYSAGFGYELLLAKMDYLEYKFLELQTEVKEQSESLLGRTGEILEQQKIFSNHEKIMNSIYTLNPRKHPADNSQLLNYQTDAFYRKPQMPTSITSIVSSCRSETSKKSGRYWMQLDGSDPFQVYCEQTFYGGGWIVVQNRFNGSVHFNRTWTEYKNGFGSLDGEFWLGLEKIHKITTATVNELLIHLEDFDGLAKYARYKRFTVGAESVQYTLVAVEGHSGNLEDSLKRHKGKKFSTPEVDNDNDSGRNCADVYSSGWWFDNCFDSNLNGVYTDIGNHFSMSWQKFTGSFKGMRVSKMMIKEA